jgi:hypothetical protein
MRIRNAILITALRRLGEPLRMTHADAYEAARFDAQVQQHLGEIVVSLRAAPTHQQKETSC